jgi:hypothetical protein
MPQSVKFFAICEEFPARHTALLAGGYVMFGCGFAALGSIFEFPAGAIFIQTSPFGLSGASRTGLILSPRAIKPPHYPYTAKPYLHYVP